MTTTPEPDWAAALGQMSAALERGIKDFFSRFETARERALRPATVDDPEEIRKRIHELRINREREIGLAYVRKAARQARRELGIEEATNG